MKGWGIRVSDKQELRYKDDMGYQVTRIKDYVEKEGNTYDDTYLKYFNDICPRCFSKMKFEDGLIQEVSRVYIGIASKKGFVFTYVVCTQCDIEIKKVFDEGTHVQDYAKQKRMQEYIEYQVPHLNKWKNKVEYWRFIEIGYWEGNEDIEVVKMEDGKVFALCEWDGKGYINCWRCTGRSRKDASKERYTIVPTYRKVNGYEDRDWVEVASYQVYEN